jgi:hypothetical protein
MGHKHVRVAVDDLPWEPWDLYFKGAPPNPESGEYGGWCKVLRRPEGEDTHWTFLLKLVPPAGKKIRFVAIAGSNEEGYLLSGSAIDAQGRRTLQAGSYLFHSAGAPHAGFLDEEHLVLVHYDGDPDIVQEFEVVD